MGAATTGGGGREVGAMTALSAGAAFTARGRSFSAPTPVSAASGIIVAAGAGDGAVDSCSFKVSAGGTSGPELGASAAGVDVRGFSFNEAIVPDESLVSAAATVGPEEATSLTAVVDEPELAAGSFEGAGVPSVRARGLSRRRGGFCSSLMVRRG